MHCFVARNVQRNDETINNNETMGTQVLTSICLSQSPQKKKTSKESERTAVVSDHHSLYFPPSHNQKTNNRKNICPVLSCPVLSCPAPLENLSPSPTCIRWSWPCCGGAPAPTPSAPWQPAGGTACTSTRPAGCPRRAPRTRSGTTRCSSRTRCSPPCSAQRQVPRSFGQFGPFDLFCAVHMRFSF